MEAGLDVGADGKEADQEEILLTAAVRISTRLLGDELLSGSPQEDEKPLIRLFSLRPRRPRVSFTEAKCLFTEAGGRPDVWES